MPFYWAIGGLPELAELQKAERKKVINEVLRGNRKLLGMAVMAALMSSVFYLGMLLGAKPGSWQWIVSLFVGAYIGNLAMHQVWIRQFRSDIRARVAKISESRDS